MPLFCRGWSPSHRSQTPLQVSRINKYVWTSYSMPVTKNSIPLLQARNLPRLTPHQSLLPTISRLDARLQHLPPIKIQILAQLTRIQPKSSIQNITPRALSRSYHPLRMQIHNNFKDPLEYKHTYDPRCEALQSRDHRARIDAKDADILEGSFLIHPPLEIMHHPDQEEFGGAVAAISSLEGRVLFG